MGWGHQGDPGGARGLLDSKLAGSQPPGAGRDAPLSLVIGGHRGGHAHASGRPGLAAGAAEDVWVFPWGNRLNQRGKAPEGRGVVLEGRLALRVISFCMEFTCAVIGSNEYSYKNTQSQVYHRI